VDERAGQLAMLGGTRAVPDRLRQVTWPVVTDADRAAVNGVLDSGRFVATSPHASEIDAFERDWADFTGTAHAVAVSSGTAALALALGALGVEAGDEVLVPAFGFVGSPLAVLHQLAIPIFVDIEPSTFNLDVARAESLIGPRTRAVMPVHMHGLPVDMTALRSMAQRHGLAVVEDAAQAAGATCAGRAAGSLGDVGVISLNVTKNLPTCGEGGMLSTDDAAVAGRLRAMRQFGEVIRRGEARRYESGSFGWNLKPGAVQCAFSRSQLRRLPAEHATRTANVQRLLTGIGTLPGLVVPQVPHDRTHAWHIIRLRFDPAAAGAADVPPEALRRVMRRALSAEGVALSRYQRLALPDQQVFQDRAGFGDGYPWRLAGADRLPPPAGTGFPQTRRIIDDSVTIERVHLNPAGGELLEHYETAFRKVWDHLDVVLGMARTFAGQLQPAGRR
jgi:dTDP-4-amino-4,6-dideoxygalactose transaminase